jgi:hypothetical protein
MLVKAPDLTALWHGAMKKMWRGTIENGGIDFVASIDTIAYDNLLSTPSMAFDFDLGRDLWLTKARWTMLLRQYLDPDETSAFIERGCEIATGAGKRGVVTSMHCAGVTRRAKRHRWGNCMAAFTFRGLGKTDGAPTLTLHSRVSYIAYIGGLDLALAHVLAREIGDRSGIAVEDIGFRWHVDALQFHGFKSLPLLYRKAYVRDLETAALRRKYPTISLVGKWWDKIVADEESGKPLSEERYGPLRRVRRRYQEYMAEDRSHTPPFPIEDMTLRPLYR